MQGSNPSTGEAERAYFTCTWYQNALVNIGIFNLLKMKFSEIEESMCNGNKSEGIGHNEELSDLYSSPNIVRVIKSRRMGWAGHVARIGSWWGNRRERPLRRPRRRWMDNIRMDLQEVGCGYMDWIGLAQDRDRWRTLVSAVMNLRVP